MFPVLPYVLAILAASAKLLAVAADALDPPFALGDIRENKVAFIAPAPPPVVKPN